MNDDKINIVGDVSGTDIRIVQVYAPGACELTPEVFVRSDGAAPFSVEWLLFSQESIPFIGRNEEREAILRFLDNRGQFVWWAITGNGGYGKSRFALNILQHLPEGWEGGFLSRRILTARDTAAWQPRSNMLWVIDDAASVGDLGSIIGNWAALHNDGPYKLRLLLLERSYSDAVGWWAELTLKLSPQVPAINRTLFEPPLELAPLGRLADTFLATLRDQLDATTSARLEAALATMGEEKVLKYSQSGNPLLLMLLAAELLSEDAGPGAISVDSGTLVERYFWRELDLLKERCDAAQLRFRVMLDLLFLTTSCSPIKLLLDHDKLIVQDGDRVILDRNSEGLLYVPNVARLRELGVDVDNYKRPKLDALNSILQIDDVQAYLSVLDETGLSARRYAIEPDLIAAVLFNLIFNSPETSTNLKRRRGEFSAARVSRLIGGAIELSPNDAWAAWGRLSDRTLSTLVSYMRELGTTIRWPILVMRELNRRRSSKVPFDADRLFAPNNVHANAPEVGRYFAELREAIAREPLDDATVAALAASPHCWTAPYVDSLLELSWLEQLQLGLVICSISDAAILERLTNLENFLVCVRTATTNVTERQLSEPEVVALYRLVDALFDFATTRAWPTIARVDDRSYSVLYVLLARVLTTASFIVANQLRGREETAATRRQALTGLDLAREALAIAPSPGDLEYVDRNAAILRAHDVEEPIEAAKLYQQTLDAMQPYAVAKAYTGAIEDLLFLSEKRSAPQMLETLLDILNTAPRALVLGEKVLWRVCDMLVTIAQSGAETDGALAARLTPPFLRCFAEHLRDTEDADTARTITQLAALMANLARTPGQQGEAARLIADLHTSLEDKPPSPTFLRALLGGVQVVQHLLRQRQSASEALIPFVTRFTPLTKANLEPLIEDDAEQAKLDSLIGMTIATTRYTLNGELFVSFGILIELAEGREDDLAVAEPFAHVLFERLRAREAARWEINGPEAPPSD